MPKLTWIGKDKIINHHREVPFRVLQHQYGFANGAVTATHSNSGNQIIHGDNLEALKSLLPQYEAKIKCIYIDPPYNTGNENWVYNDNVNDPKIQKWLQNVVGKAGEDLSRHDKWLCMMYPRLQLLHQLLAHDGVIFISIDDNEQAHLRLVMDEIFGEHNFAASIVWQSRQSIQNDTDLSVNHEYLLAYAKKRRQKNRRLKPQNIDTWFTEDTFAFFPTAVDDAKYDNPDNDVRGSWKADPFDAPNVRPNLTYPITNPNTGEVFLPPQGRCWRTEPDKYLKLLSENRIIFGKSGKSKPQLKVFLNEKSDFGSIANTWFTGEEVGTATHGTKELQKIFEKGYEFETPKPTRLIEKILQIATNKNDIILDSFAGSGTTAHAVLNLNQADGGNRKFILIEMEDYAETITAERVKRVIKGYGKTAGIQGAFDYYKLGERLFGEDNLLNPKVDIALIRNYIWYSETRKELNSIVQTIDNPYFLGQNDGIAYYFHYELDKTTSLSHAFLETVRTPATHYVMYADKCTLSETQLEKYRITFKKIPRDITRF